MKTALIALFFLIAPEIGTLKNDVVHVDAKEASQLLETDEKVVVLDVRTAGEFRQSRIEGATQIDFRGPNFAREAAKLDPDTTYLVHCRSGGRSSRALSVLKDLGIENLYHLDGGMLAWQSEDLPTVQGDGQK